MMAQKLATFCRRNERDLFIVAFPVAMALLISASSLGGSGLFLLTWMVARSLINA